MLAFLVLCSVGSNQVSCGDRHYESHVCIHYMSKCIDCLFFFGIKALLLALQFFPFLLQEQIQFQEEYQSSGSGWKGDCIVLAVLLALLFFVARADLITKGVAVRSGWKGESKALLSSLVL